MNRFNKNENKPFLSSTISPIGQFSPLLSNSSEFPLLQRNPFPLTCIKYYRKKCTHASGNLSHSLLWSLKS